MSRLLNRLNLKFMKYSRFQNTFYRLHRVHSRFIPKERQNVISISHNSSAVTKSLTRHVSSDISDTEMDPVLTEIDETCDLFRQTLYVSEVPEIEALNRVCNVQELLEVLKVEQNAREICKEVVCQTIIILWDILRQDLMIKQGPFPVLKTKKTELEHVQKSIITCPEIQSVLKNLKICLKRDQLTFDELSCALMYLNKLGFAIKDPLIQQIIQVFLDKLSSIESPTSVPLSALSRFVVAIFEEIGLYPYYACINILPYIYRHLETCDSSENIRLITICLNELAKMVPNDILYLYKTKIEEFIASGVLNNSTIKTNLKILLFLNYPEWATHNTKLTRDLLLLIGSDIETFQVKELFLIQKNVRNRLEPWSLIPKIVRRADELMDESPCPEMLTCSLLETLPEKREKLTKNVENFISNLDPSCDDSTIPALFKALRLLKTSNVTLYDMYWDKVVDDIRSDTNNIFKTIRHIHRYMHFNNNLGGTYRHRDLEKEIILYLFREFETGLTAYMPSAFARSLSFILAYSFNLAREEAMPDFILSKIESMTEQFNMYDCLRMSKGIQIAHDLRYKFYIPTREAPYLLKIEEVLNACAERHIRQSDLTIHDLNLILKAFNARKCSRKSNLFQRIISKYDEIEDLDVSSRTIRDTTYNLVTSAYRSPKLFERFITYFIQNREFVGAETLEKALTCFLSLGYAPGNEEFYKISNEIIKRDFNFISGLSIIQSCLALTFFKALDKSLISQVFNINFIKRLEEEIKSCYSKETYPERVLNSVMQLNRAVCLDCPEANIPWFQQNYIEAQMSKAPNIESKFNMDIKQTLHELVHDRSWLKQNLVTPYGYKIDFVLYLNEKGKFIPPPPEDRPILGKVTKLAIIPLRAEAFCENPPYTDLKGFDALKKYHLEILGYKVIHVNYRDWNSMYLNLPGARLDHIKRQIGIS